MNRRHFFRMIACATAACSVSGRAQSASQRPIIGFLGAGEPAGAAHWAAAFASSLRELGWTEGTNISIEYRWAEGRTERSAAIADEFVLMKVDVIVTYGSAAVAVAKRATSTIPIVFAAVGDPVGAGFVASLARPGGNITGMSMQETDLGPKRLQFLREAVPKVDRLGIMAHVASAGAVLEMQAVERVARRLGMQVSKSEIQQPKDIAEAFAAFRGRVDALFVVTDPFLFTNRMQIHSLALDTRLPTICDYREYVEAGCLLSYGPSHTDLFRRTAGHVDKILRGSNPGDLPVEQPTKFEYVLNVRTAKTLGLEVSSTLLALVDEVIE
jgi:putative tryptophan/tyrosine transport system substrate-binding protein